MRDMNRHRSLTFLASSSIATFDATFRSDASRAATPSGPAGSGVTGSADPVAASGSSTVTGTSSYASASLFIVRSPPSSPAGPCSSRGRWRSSGKTSSRVSGRHRPWDRAPPTPASAARTSAQKNARSSSLRAAAFASTASSTCGGRGRLPERFMWPPRPPRPPPPLPRPFLSPPRPPLPPRPPRPPRPRDMRSAATGAKASSGRAADIVARSPRASRLCRETRRRRFTATDDRGRRLNNKENFARRDRRGRAT